MAQRIPHAAGCIVVRTHDNQPLFLVIRDQYGCWTFPKGHLESGETSQHAAIREVFEETGIRGELGPHITTIFYDVIKKGQTVRKQVDWYLLSTTQIEVNLQAEEGIHEYAWLTDGAVEERLGYPALIPVFQLARSFLASA